MKDSEKSGPSLGDIPKNKRKDRFPRKALMIAGFSLLAAALVLIGIGVWSIVSSDLAAEESVREAEQMIQDAQKMAEAEQMVDEYSGNPNSPAQPDQSPATDDQNQPVASGQTQNNSNNGQNTTPSSPKPTPNILGMLVFDSLGGRKVAVMEGASPQDLARGAGHNEITSPPGIPGNCLIFGHRDTVFRGFKNLKMGDTIHMKTAGNDYTYRVTNMQIVDPGDPLIYAVYSQPTVTLVTCYPFDFVGHAPQRYVVVATLVS
jgi:sortase A